MDILFCTSEAYPLIKTGGLADVSGSLPKALHDMGNDIRLVLPAYPEAVAKTERLVPVANLSLEGASAPVEILAGRFPGSRMKVYLVNAPEYFSRSGNPYVQEDGSDWPDNAERFALFARAIVALALDRLGMNWKPELVHCNDWQTGLVPPLLAQHSNRPATLFTIHNLAYQGLFPAETFHTLALPASLWSIDGVEFHGQLSFMKSGIAGADWITTVSPTYAEEIRTSTYGYGLEGLLQYRADHLTGILNGMDCEIWDPATDPWIKRNYDARTLQHKAPNKSALQRQLGLPAKPGQLLFAHIGRLVEQKGVDLILDILDELFLYPVQLVLLGSGDSELEALLSAAATRYPEQLAIHIGYDEQLAHRIKAGADCFLMPSRYEPCGLNQMYSLRYGTVPVVHRTGGLADSVNDLNEKTATDYTATGFSFAQDSSEELLDACTRAIDYFRTSRVDWWKLVITGMRENFCWSESAGQYLDLYIHTCNLVRAGMLETGESEYLAL